DHTLGVANGWAGTSGMTAELTLRYHRLTPLFEPITVAARQVSVAGRTNRTTGEITANGEPCVTAEGLFIATYPPRPRGQAGGAQVPGPETSTPPLPDRDPSGSASRSGSWSQRHEK